MPQKNVKRAYMICETPKALEALGVDEETARMFADKFSSVRLTEKTRAAIAAAAKPNVPRNRRRTGRYCGRCYPTL